MRGKWNCWCRNIETIWRWVMIMVASQCILMTSRSLGLKAIRTDPRTANLTTTSPTTNSYPQIPAKLLSPSPITQNNLPKPMISPSISYNGHKNFFKYNKTSTKNAEISKPNTTWLKSFNKSYLKFKPTYLSSRKYSTLPPMLLTYIVRTLLGSSNHVYCPLRSII